MIDYRKFWLNHAKRECIDLIISEIKEKRQKNDHSEVLKELRHLISEIQKTLYSNEEIGKL